MGFLNFFLVPFRQVNSRSNVLGGSSQRVLIPREATGTAEQSLSKMTSSCMFKSNFYRAFESQSLEVHLRYTILHRSPASHISSRV